MMSIVSIIIPVYNEQKSITILLNKVLASELPDNFTKEIILVDDCSTDETKHILANFINTKNDETIKLITHQTNKGKGAAIHSGIKHANGDYILIQDADLEYDPDEYKLLLSPIIKANADVVYGSRFMGGKPHRVLFFWHSIGNKALTFLSNVFTDFNLTDMETCYKLFKADILKQLELREKRFGFEPEVTAKISRIKGIKVYEVGISYFGRTYQEGKKINWKDGMRAIWCILKYGAFKFR